MYRLFSEDTTSNCVEQCTSTKIFIQKYSVLICHVFHRSHDITTHNIKPHLVFSHTLLISFVIWINFWVFYDSTVTNLWLLLFHRCFFFQLFTLQITNIFYRGYFKAQCWSKSSANSKQAREVSGHVYVCLGN